MGDEFGSYGTFPQSAAPGGLVDLMEGRGAGRNVSGYLKHLLVVDVGLLEPVGTTSAGELEDLYRQHRVGLVRLAGLLTGSRDLAEEVVQDSFVKLHASLDRARNPAAYLRQIVVNESRQLNRRRAVEERLAPVPGPPFLPPEVDEVWDALWDLPVRQREALVLRFYEDLTVREIAGAMECPSGTVKSLLHRGLVALKEVVER